MNVLNWWLFFSWKVAMINVPYRIYYIEIVKGIC